MAEEIVAEKQCTICKQIRPMSDFHGCRARKDGLQSGCKRCVAEAKRRYETTPKAKSAKKLWKQSPKGLAMLRRRYQQEKASGRYHARRAVGYAVERGLLPPANTLRCQHCEKQAEEYHHYLGYDSEHRLSVIPLCVKCHALEESKN